MEQLIVWAQNLGTAGAAVFAYLWWIERAERKEMTALLLKMVPENVAALRDNKAALDMLRVAMGAKPEPSSGSTK